MRAHPERWAPDCRPRPIGKNIDDMNIGWAERHDGPRFLA
jgi:hypothetical protein